MEKLSSDQNNETPFGDNLVESGISEVHKGRGKLFEFEHNLDKVVRVESFDALEKRYKGQVDPITVAGFGKKLYGELESDYGITAPVEFVVGKDVRGRNVVYGITDKIEGENLDKIKVTSEITEEVEKLYAKIAQYYLDKLSKDEMYLADINNASQYVFGKRKSDELAKIYLIDTDLYIRDGKVALYNIVLWLVRHMSSVERKYNKKFNQARNIIGQLLHEPVPQSVNEKGKIVAEEIITKALGYISGEIPEDDDDAHPIFSNLEG